MRLNRSRSRVRALAVSGAVLACLALPAAASADTTSGLTIQPAASRGATITMAPTIRITSRVMATVEVGFVCDPFEIYDWDTGETRTTTDGQLEGGTFVVVQAQGRSIASASADLFGGAVVCDGTTVQRRSVSVIASNLPWKAGAAVAGVSMYAVDPLGQSGHYASTGPVAVKLVK